MKTKLENRFVIPKTFSINSSKLLHSPIYDTVAYTFCCSLCLSFTKLIWQPSRFLEQSPYISHYVLSLPSHLSSLGSSIVYIPTGDTSRRMSFVLIQVYPISHPPQCPPLKQQSVRSTVRLLFSTRHHPAPLGPFFHQSAAGYPFPDQSIFTPICLIVHLSCALLARSPIATL